MDRSIMVPLDGSVFSEHALPLALSIAQRTASAVQLVHVHIPAGSLYDVTGLPALDHRIDSEAREFEQEYLTNLAQRLATTWGVKVTLALLDEDNKIAEILHQQALASGCDLIVMTTQGRSGIARMWRGSVAESLVRQAPMPVVLVRLHREMLDLLDLTREQAVKQILIPLDGSTLAEAILDPAIALAKALGAECTLLQAINPVVADDPVDALVIGQDEQLPARWKAEVGAYLERIAVRVRGEGLSVRTTIAVGPAAEAILAYSRENLVDLIAMATHGHGGITRLFVGSVAEKVVRCACPPVLVYRPSAAADRLDTLSSGVEVCQSDTAARGS